MLGSRHVSNHPVRRFGWFRSHASVVLLLGLVLPAGAALPTDPEEKAQIAGQPVSLQVQPEAITLDGPRATQQIIVTGKYADDSVRDLTPFASLVCESPAIASIGADGFVVPKKNGTTA